jgi:hypothetical protein
MLHGWRMANELPVGSLDGPMFNCNMQMLLTPMLIIHSGQLLLCKICAQMVKM